MVENVAQLKLRNIKLMNYIIKNMGIIAEEGLQVEKDKVESDKKELANKNAREITLKIEAQNKARIIELVGQGEAYDIERAERLPRLKRK